MQEPSGIKRSLLKTTRVSYFISTYDFSQLETSIFRWDVQASQFGLPIGNIAYVCL